MPSQRIDGNDCFAVHSAAASRRRARARRRWPVVHRGHDVPLARARGGPRGPVRRAPRPGRDRRMGRARSRRPARAAAARRPAWPRARSTSSTRRSTRRSRPRSSSPRASPEPSPEQAFTDMWAETEAVGQGRCGMSGSAQQLEKNLGTAATVEGKRHDVHRGLRRGDPRGDGARRARLHHGRGHRGGDARADLRPARAVRGLARPQHARSARRPSWAPGPAPRRRA